MKRSVEKLRSFLSDLPKDMWVIVMMTPVIIILGDYLAVAPAGTTLLLGFAVYAVVAGVIGGLAVPVLLVRSLFRKYRRKSLGWAFLCSVWCALTIPSLLIGNSIREAAFQKLTEESEPLVSSIKQFQTEAGHPPESLEDLVPAYIDKVPQTGMGAYPEYQYLTGAVFSEFKGEDWMLFIRTSSGGINFDRFVYVPSEVYPEKGQSGFYRPVGNWAYYHE